MVLVSTYNANVYGLRVSFPYVKGNTILSLIGAGYFTALHFALARVTRLSFGRQIIATAALVAIFALLFEISHRLMLTAFNFRMEPLLDQPLKLLAVALFWLAPFGLWAAASLALRHHHELRARDRQLADLQALAQEAQMRALRYQVNPHFLHNTLNSIATLILDKRNRVAEAMVLALADFFRASFTTDPAADITLAEEVKVQKLYLDIEQLRFGAALDVEIDVPADVAAARVPSFILQPLVENAVKHGAPKAGRSLQVRLAARRVGERLVIEVANSGIGRSRRGGSGIGQRNVADRLAARFGDAAVFHAGPVDAGYVVTLTLPFVRT